MLQRTVLLHQQLLCYDAGNDRFYYITFLALRLPDEPFQLDAIGDVLALAVPLRGRIKVEIQVQF